MAVNGTVCENWDVFLLVSDCKSFNENCWPWGLWTLSVACLGTRTVACCKILLLFAWSYEKIWAVMISDDYLSWRDDRPFGWTTSELPRSHPPTHYI